jgi:hypothetical protein
MALSDRLEIRVQPIEAELIAKAAHVQGMSYSAWCRQAIRTGLQLAGFDPADIAPRDAGSLYNVVEGHRHWALVIGDSIRSFHRSPDKPADEQGGVWLPIEYEDSEPFDIDQHWRLAPVDTIEAERVVRTYPVVLKSEHA